MKEELKKLFLSIMEHQMDNFELARTTKPYKLAEEGIKLLGGPEVIKIKNVQNYLPSELIALKAYYDAKYAGIEGCRSQDQVDAQKMSIDIEKRLNEIANSLL